MIWVFSDIILNIKQATDQVCLPSIQLYIEHYMTIIDQPNNDCHIFVIKIYPNNSSEFSNTFSEISGNSQNNKNEYSDGFSEMLHGLIGFLSMNVN